MTDPLDPRRHVEGEYTDSELPLSAELPIEDYEEVEDLAGEPDAADLDDDVEIDEVYELDDADVDVVGIDDPDRVIPPDRDTPL
ncbi:hypothetical protein [Agromyces albus]|uniref:Uncharacterized protein n=1 Tax=Agromyces albus TaxID=205332 RepID=A0A4Q2KWU5_9MICO|nr:hypothetical protein [Agromyces albus]RXZ68353.1 hypothetical protein ESP51_13830 [Agromyces albus]